MMILLMACTNGPPKMINDTYCTRLRPITFHENEIEILKNNKKEMRHLIEQLLKINFDYEFYCAYKI